MVGPWDDDAPQEDRFQKERGEYCELCDRSDKYMELFKCPMCHKYICDKCRYGMGGKDFCGDHCANEFFFGGEDEE